MELNKEIMFYSIILAFLCFVAMLFFDQDSILSNLVCNLLAGLLVSFINALIYYLNKKQR